MSVQKYSLLCVLQIFFALHSYGQHTHQISHYMFNSQMYNPASVGFSNSIVASGINRQQWYGGEGVPKTTLISIDAPIRKIQSGVGLNIFSDKIGMYKSNIFQLSYNYQMPVFQGTIGFGARFGLNSMGLELTTATPPETSGDPLLQGKEDVSQFLFDVSLGVFYQVSDQYEIGLSLENINQPKSNELAHRQKRTLNLFANYHFTSDMFPTIDFVPSMLVKTEFSDMSIDMSLIGVHNKQYWGGLSYRVGDAVTLLGGLFINQFQIGVAYDLTTNWMFKTSKIGGGFEIFVRCNFNLSLDRLPQSYKNSRYL